MGLFDFFKKKEEPKAQPQNLPLLAMPLFTQGNQYSLQAVAEHLKTHWGLTITSTEGNDDTAVLVIEGEMVMMAYLPGPIPQSDIEGAARYAYNWPTVLQELEDFTGHAVVSIVSGPKSILEKYQLFSKVLHAVLSTSGAIGVYQGGQTLLIPREQYLASAETLQSGKLPIDLWIYLGLRKSDSGNSVYTYGLTEFGKQEMEVIDSKLGLEELSTFVLNISLYVIRNNITFKSGETLGYTAEQKIKISSSKGQFVEGQSLKLAM
jgi:hypothetical protein